MLQNIMNNYGQFFSINSFLNVITSPSNWGIILTLMLLEGLLSVDNALALAMIAEHLPKKLRRKALFYGIWGAYIFRFIAIGLGTSLIKIWWIKLIAAAYLLHMAYTGLFGTDEDNNENTHAYQKGFWATIATIEGMDIAFSLDSVTAAFGVSDKVWVLFLGAVFGILMMRGVADLFTKLIEKVPELKKTAFVLIAIIGFKMVFGTFGFQIPDMFFFSLLIIAFASTFIVHKFRLTT